MYWKDRPFLDALFRPSVGQLAHYLGERSMSGPNAAAGAHTSLSGCAKARETAHGYVFVKNKGKPFPLVLPKETWGAGDGYKSMLVSMSSLRTSFNEDEDPFLMSQFGPCTTVPFSATTWRSAPMSSYQMARAREAIMRPPPPVLHRRFALLRLR